MTDEQETNLGKKLTGSLRLNDSEALGITGVLIFVKDDGGRLHALTSPGPTETECLPGGVVQTAYHFSVPEGPIEYGPPLPIKPDGPYFPWPHENCYWLVHSEQNTGGDWIQKSRRCIGWEGVSGCIINKTIIVV